MSRKKKKKNKPHGNEPEYRPVEGTDNTELLGFPDLVTPGDGDNLEL